MGSKSVVYGFIELDPGFTVSNQKAIDSYEFDDVYPFNNIFSRMHHGYGSSLVSFAGTAKSLFDEWEEWETKFDTLLSRLYSRSAVVRLSDDVDGELLLLMYVCDDGWKPEIKPQQRKWGKYRTNRNGQSVEEFELKKPEE